MSAPELKPCPFCGSDDVFAERSDYTASHILCNNCIARGPDCDPQNDEDLELEEANDWGSGEAAARREWNHRADITQGKPSQSEVLLAEILETWEHQKTPQSFYDAFRLMFPKPSPNKQEGSA